MKPLNEQALNAVTTSANSNAIDSSFHIAGSCQIIASGTIAGAVKLQYSNDAQNTFGLPTNWSDVPSATVTLTGTAGIFSIPKTDLCYNFVRVVFTVSGGTGSVTANYHSFAF